MVRLEPYQQKSRTSPDQPKQAWYGWYGYPARTPPTTPQTSPAHNRQPTRRTHLKGEQHVIQLATEPAILLTVEEAAQRLRIGRTKMYSLISTGEVKSVTIGTSRRVPAEALTEYVSALVAIDQTARAA